jgi:hypothetical protein
MEFPNHLACQIRGWLILKLKQTFRCPNFIQPYQSNRIFNAERKEPPPDPPPSHVIRCFSLASAKTTFLSDQKTTSLGLPGMSVCLQETNIGKSIRQVRLVPTLEMIAAV